MSSHRKRTWRLKTAASATGMALVAALAILVANPVADAQEATPTAANARILRTHVITYTQKQVNALIAQAVAKQKAHDDAIIARLRHRLHPTPSPTPTGGTSSSPGPVTSPTPAPSSTPTTSPTPDSTAIPLSFPGYTRVLAQNFDTDAAVGAFADKYPGWAGYDGNTSGASGTKWNSKTTMSVQNSVLRMRNWVSNGVPQAGALTPLVGSAPWYQQAQTYGKYVVRFKADSVHGFKVAWLLWPSSGNWSEGEVDFPEANLDGNIQYSTHNVVGNPEDQIWGDAGVKMSSGWHTATTTWEPGKVTYDLDGKVVHVETNPKYVPTHPMRWDLQNEISTDGSKPAANADGSVYIDWVAQYRYDAAK